jgi:hypothetical protein
MIAAGVNARALATCMGHANISITLGRYGTSGPARVPRRVGCLMPIWIARSCPGVPAAVPTRL